MTTSTDRPLPAHQGTRSQRFLAGLATPGGAVFVLCLLLFAAIVWSNPIFAEPDRLIRWTSQAVPIAILALGQYFVIVSGEFDLSMGAVIGAQVVLAGNLIGDDDSKIVPVMLLMIAVGIAVGLINGLVTTILGVPSFIVTLGMMLALNGMLDFLTSGSATGLPTETFRAIGRSGIQDVPVIGVLPYPVLILLACCVLAYLLTRRPYGRTLIAAGDNPHAAQVGGATLWWVKTRAFVLSSLAATLAGIILVGQAGVSPAVGDGYEFQAITAVVLGGVVLGGGRGWVLSAAGGAIALQLLFSLINLRDIPTTWNETFQGAIIILAVAVAGRAWRSGRRRPLRLRRPSPTANSDPPPD